MNAGLDRTAWLQGLKPSLIAGLAAGLKLALPGTIYEIASSFVSSEHLLEYVHAKWFSC